MNASRFLIGALTMALLCFADAADLPSTLVPEGLGVNIHFVRGHERHLDLIAAAGIRIVRMDFTWTEIERKKGEYDWSGYDELTANLAKRGLRPLFILDYSNPLYEPAVGSTNPITGVAHLTTGSPRSSESVGAFAKWSAAAAKRYSEHRVIWEIWNEPNIFFWSPKPDVKEYTALALAACKAIRGAAPGATIVAPATSGFPWEFLESFFAAGALEWIDAVSVHPYRSYERGPETAAADYDRLRGLLKKHLSGDKRDMPILSGEWGYATQSPGGVSKETQAAFAVRQQLFNLSKRIPLSIWYDWKNDGPDRAEREHNFGIVREDLSPKPAYRALKVFATELRGLSFERRLALDRADDWALVFTNAAGAVRAAAWTTGKPHSAKIDVKELAGNKGVVAVALDGVEKEATMEDGKLTTELRQNPEFFKLRN